MRVKFNPADICTSSLVASVLAYPSDILKNEKLGKRIGSYLEEHSYFYRCYYKEETDFRYGKAEYPSYNDLVSAIEVFNPNFKNENLDNTKNTESEKFERKKKKFWFF